MLLHFPRGASVRHRLNRGGDRQLNRALHTIVLIRRSTHEPTRAYIARRRSDGKTEREAVRCLKRYLARSLYRLLGPATPARRSSSDPAAPALDTNRSIKAEAFIGIALREWAYGHVWCSSAHRARALDGWLRCYNSAAPTDHSEPHPSAASHRHRTTTPSPRRAERRQ